MKNKPILEGITDNRADNMAHKLHKARVIAVLVIEKLEDADHVLEALMEGGVSCLELTLRTKASFKILSQVVKKYPKLITGVGTVLSLEQLRRARDLGAHFAVSPGINRKIVERAKAMDLPFFPGIATPSDIEVALENGCRCLKFFPAEPLGGLRYLASISTPYRHLGIKFIPLGGINPDNAESYLKSELVLALGGSWLADKKLIAAKNWPEIRSRASSIMKLVKTSGEAVNRSSKRKQ